MSNIVPFSYGERQVRVIQDEAGNPWWVAKDVCDVLDLSNVTMALLPLDEDEKRDLSKTELGHDSKGLRAVNEPGLYSLIMRSNKPEAKAFKRWVTHEVLPAIRKTGTYTVKKAAPVKTVEGITVPEKISASLIKKEYKAFCDIGRFVGLDTNQARLSANKAIRRIFGTDILETLGATKFIAEDQQREYCPRDIGVILTERHGENYSAQRVNKCLCGMGFQERNHLKEWIPTIEGRLYAVLKDAPKQHNPNGTPVKQLFWKAEVIDIISARRSAIKSITDDEEGGDQ